MSAAKQPMFAPKPCACECRCGEPITPDEAREFKGLCIACYGGFHGLQAALRAAQSKEPTE